MSSNQFKAHGAAFGNTYFQKHDITHSAKIYVFIYAKSILRLKTCYQFFGQLFYVSSLNVLYLLNKYTYFILVPPLPPPLPVSHLSKSSFTFGSDSIWSSGQNMHNSSVKISTSLKILTIPIPPFSSHQQRHNSNSFMCYPIKKSAVPTILCSDILFHI